MADEPSDEPAHVTDEERRHPAYRLLARAMLTLARLKGGQEAGERSAPGKREQEPEAGNG